MVADFAKLDEINLLASDTRWAWPQAMRAIFQPRGVNLMVARDAGQFVDIIRKRRIHTTIVDMDSDRAGGLAIVKIIRMHQPLLPCILLASDTDIFGVIDKPVDMKVLRQSLNRLFTRMYNCDVFG